MIRTRFSPSPTGMIHLGNARAALFSALFAGHEHGQFILRIEDTDQSRSEHKYTDIIQEDLRWLGLQWKEGPDIGGPFAPYWQSKRHEIYDKYYQKLEVMGQVYSCFCSEQELALQRKLQLSRGQPPRYSGVCRKLGKEEITKRIAEGKKPTLRFHVPNNSPIDFIDVIKGPQHFNSDDIGDFIIRRADETASFLFCNAIDDSLMGISHVIRGEDHLANTPRQLMILQALEMRVPQYGHLSLIMGADGGKLSKRHGSSSLHDIKNEGYLTGAVLNYLSRLSHTYEEQRLMSFDELAKHFSLEKISRAPARFDTNQLLYWQKEAVVKLDRASFWEWLGPQLQKHVPEDKLELFTEVMRHNILFPKEAIKWVDILFKNDLHISIEKQLILQDAGLYFFEVAQNATSVYQGDLKRILEEIKSKCQIYGKKLFMPIRIALTGEEHGPELMHIASLLGAEKLQQRFKLAAEHLHI